jgi:hypothetical protein
MLGTAVRFGIFVAASSFMLVCVANSVAAQDGIPNLIGAWKGHALGGAHFGELGHDEPTTEPRFKDLSMPWTLTVAEQVGRGLIGTWSSPKKSERLVGVISADNVTVYFVDEDTYFTGKLESEDRMELCARETGNDSMVAACFIIDKQ